MNARARAREKERERERERKRECVRKSTWCVGVCIICCAYFKPSAYYTTPTADTVTVKLHTASARSLPSYTSYRNVHRSVLELLTTMVWYIQNERIKFLIIIVPYFWSINDLFWGFIWINSFLFLSYFFKTRREFRIRISIGTFKCERWIPKYIRICNYLLCTV